MLVVLRLFRVVAGCSGSLLALCYAVARVFGLTVLIASWGLIRGHTCRAGASTVLHQSPEELHSSRTPGNGCQTVRLMLVCVPMMLSMSGMPFW